MTEGAIYLPPSLRGFVNKRAVMSTWVDHLPFGYDLVEAQRPKIIVELGAQAGLSYFLFCQAVREHAVQARSYAVDTWAGDEHTGGYDDRVYQDVAAHNDEHYRDFSELLRMRFEDAVGRFEDGSIDLCHIDGFHTYDAVKQDFATWYPKVSPGGILLFHDIRARMMDFGAWHFWDELAPQYPSFTFKHGFGLGVIRKPGGAALEAPLLQLLFSGDEETEARLRAFYVHASRHVDLRRHKQLIDSIRDGIKAKMREERLAAKARGE